MDQQFKPPIKITVPTNKPTPLHGLELLTSSKSVLTNNAFESITRLLAAFEIARKLVSEPSVQKANYKMTFIPSEGNSTIYLHPSIAPGDEIGIKILTGTIGGKKQAVAFVREKYSSTRSAKTTIDLGGDPLIKAELKYAGLESLISELDRMIAASKDANITFNLSELRAAADIESKARRALLELDCGKNPENIRKATEIIESINDLVRRINEARKNHHQAHEVSPNDIYVDTVSGAAAKFPIIVQDEHARHDCYATTNSMISSASGREFFAKWTQDYVSSLSVGVEILEHTTSDTIGQMQNVILQTFEKICNQKFSSDDVKQKKIESFERHMENIDKRCYTLLGMVGKVDDDVNALKQAIDIQPTDAFRKICSIASKRQRLYTELKDLESEIQLLYHEFSVKTHLQLLVSNIAANLCRVGGKEISLWESLIHNPDFKEAVLHVSKHDANGCVRKSTKAFLRTINDFCDAARKENKAVSEIADRAKNNEKTLKHIVADLETRLIALIFQELQKYAPVTSQLLMAAYMDARTHVRYKQGEVFNAEDAKYYLSRPIYTFFKKSLFDNSMRNCLEGACRAYDILNSNVRQEVLEHVERLLYFQERGFDMEYTDAEWLLKKSFRHEEIIAKYRTVADAYQGEMAPQHLYVNFNKRELGINLPTLSNDAYLEIASAQRTDLKKDIYGDKLELGEILPNWNENDSLGKMYMGLFTESYQNKRREEFEKIGKLLSQSDMETPYFLASLMNGGFKAGLVSDNLGTSYPGLLRTAVSEKSTFDSAIKSAYPDYDIEKVTSDLREYAKWKTAKNIFDELSRTLPYWIKMGAGKMAAPSTASTNHFTNGFKSMPMI